MALPSSSPNKTFTLALSNFSLGDPIINRLSAVYAQSTLGKTHVQCLKTVFVGNSDIVRIMSPDLMYNRYVECIDERENPSGLFSTSVPFIFSSCDGFETQVRLEFILSLPSNHHHFLVGSSFLFQSLNPRSATPLGS